MSADEYPSPRNHRHLKAAIAMGAVAAMNDVTIIGAPAKKDTPKGIVQPTVQCPDVYTYFETFRSLAEAQAWLTARKAKRFDVPRRITVNGIKYRVHKPAYPKRPETVSDSARLARAILKRKRKAKRDATQGGCLIAVDPQDAPRGHNVPLDIEGHAGVSDTVLVEAQDGEPDDGGMSDPDHAGVSGAGVDGGDNS